MPRAEVVFTGPFSAALEEVPSDQVVDRVLNVLSQLSDFPELGSSVVQDSIAMRYGRDIRKLVVGRYLVVYRHESGVVRLLDLVYGPNVR